MPLYPQGVAFPLGNIPQSFRNLLSRNGGMEVWQRGAGGSFAETVVINTGKYVADGWFLQCVGAGTQTGVNQVGGLANGSRYAAYIQRYPGQVATSGQYCVLEYPLDTDEIVPARGSFVTLSMMLTVGPNWSATGLGIQLFTGTGTPARRTSGIYPGEAVLINVVQQPTALYARYSFTSSAVVPTNVTQAVVFISWTPTGTAGAADAFQIDDVQLEVGSVATPFERRPFESELLACQRHYYKTFPYSMAPAQGTNELTGPLAFTQATGASSTQYSSGMRWPVRMRAGPTVTLYNPVAVNAQIRNTLINADWSGSGAGGPSDSAITVYGTTPAGSAVGHNCSIHITADAGI